MNLSAEPPVATAVAHAAAIRAHRRQFVIGPRPFTAIPGWTVVPVPGVGFLSHCPELRVASGTDGGGKRRLLLGLAVQADRSRPAPAGELCAPGRTSIQDLYQSWAGRWLVVADGALHMDAGGLLGCFYGRPASAKDAGELWLSSSAALLAAILHSSTSPMRTIHYKVGFDWYTPPRSRYASILRLLPSQILDLSSGEITARSLLPRSSGVLSYEEVLAHLQDYLTATLRNVAALGGTIWLPLTGGYDSRLLLATAVHAGVPVRTVTVGFRGMAHGDRTLPPQLSQAVGVRHSFDWGHGFQRRLATQYDRHTGGQSVDYDRYLIPRAYFGNYQPGDIALGGNCFEVGRYDYRNFFPQPGLIPNPPDANTIIRSVYKVGLLWERPLASALQEWVSWVRRTPHQELDWRDRLVLEQQLAGWLSSVEQAQDLVNATSFLAANSQRFYGYVLQIPADKRAASQHHIDLMARLAPELLSFPFNPPARIRWRNLKRARARLEYYVESAAARVRPPAWRGSARRMV